MQNVPVNANRAEYNSKAPWEHIIGYCRAVCVGQSLEIAGTTAINEFGEVIGATYYDQANYILSKIESSLKHFNCDKNDIIRTRIYVIDISKWEEVAKAHNSFFEKNRPVCTLIEVSRLIRNDLLIEIEASAIKNS